MATDDDWVPLAKYIQQQLSTRPNEVITEDTRLLSTGLVDSFSLVELIVFIRKTYGVSIPAASRSIEHFDSPRQIMHLVRSLPR